ncbi:MAG TPA: SulP family inorganic anion transporter [Pirellulaceae bacterium]|nr:SulP family inorganic anion transporter [Pirellulaceae bacterium]HMO94079.1 SulP family inorganic anion transporter [Pirellulaceae bacterium]HMP71152.1 SulP family inorganic anion transporter [Pirellulaceae bacterium]
MSPLNAEGTLLPSKPPKPSDEPMITFKYFHRDFLASVVVFLVALPLCIGIAVAVGVSPARALLTGIIGGMVVGFFAGSPLQVSGPAAGLFVIVADLLAKGREKYLTQMAGTDNPAGIEEEAVMFSLMVMGSAVFIAGIIQIVAGQLQLGQWFRAVSPAVIKGMLAGIGILILISQFHVMLDHKAMWNGEKAHGGFQYLATIPEAILKCFSSDTPENHHLAALTGIITIAFIVGWPMVAPRRFRILPAALIGILVATLFSVIVNFDVQRLDVPENMFSETTLPSIPWLQLLLDPMVLTGALVIAIVASAETLLCATAVDQMHMGTRTNYDRELTAQGVGNVACGLIGALPMTGVIVRSAANVNAGAKTRLSSILHGLWLLIFVVALPFVLTYIPRSALGALLVYTGYKLVNLKQIKELWRTSKSETLIFFATMLIIVWEDLLIGVITGVILSSIKLLHRFTHLKLELYDHGKNIIRLDMDGAATFLRLPQLASKLEEVPESAELHVDFEHLSYVDHACLDLLMNWAKQHENSGGKLVIDWDRLHARFNADPMTTLATEVSEVNESTLNDSQNSVESSANDSEADQIKSKAYSASKN